MKIQNNHWFVRCCQCQNGFNTSSILALKTMAILGMFSISHAAWGRANTPEICNSAAQIASQKTGVPVSVLRAISLTETGRKSDGRFQPWPWTVNMEGKGVWFDTPAEAQVYVDRNFKRGARSFDVGCFQLNYKWHGQAFSSIEEMFDPVSNAIYAANFLRELFNEKGNWVDAAGAYHSRNPKFANRYKKRFNKLLSNLTPLRGQELGVLDSHTEAQTVTVVTVHKNTFPLLQLSSSGSASLGSLMPDSAGQGSQRFIGGG